ncbi:uncharacterized protein EAE98_004172 [Botrytis deweyae]|uniref:Uncharacterized protein n=1 Tax=Botrytis deweyae TaxID=2478750 RepID=A0ABQ7ISS6_9HELO|nr:uncharacterized protein EAE98_004172 [Botrytis deweyae]KAF7932873.1 hypothetical protein EAE98_004172 [Botrytis deweyae]
MALQEYKIVQQDDTDHSIETLMYLNLQRQLRYFKGVSFALGIFLSFSLLFNALWAHQTLQSMSIPILTPTKYTGLVRNISTPFIIDNLFTNENRTIADAAWSSPDLDSEVGLVALTDEYAKSKGLLPAQRWPWDHSKGIYVLNGFHNLHCLQLVRNLVLEAYDNVPLTYPLEHVSHCLNVLREEVMCNADDTPRYTGRLNSEKGKKHPTSGIGQTRMCNDWGKLRSWAVAHSGCFRAINESTPNFPTIERYKFCPEGMNYSSQAP